MGQSALSSDTSVDDLAIGRKIRDLRQGRSLSIKELAERAELSAGAISQIERGIGSTSLRSIRSICKALNVPLGILFHDDTLEVAEEFVRRFHQRETLNLGHGTTKQMLTAPASQKLEMLLVNVEPGGNSGPETYSHEGEEMGVILKGGVLDLYVAERKFQLKEGDSFAFPSTLPHRFANSSNASCKVIWVNSPGLYRVNGATGDVT